MSLIKQTKLFIEKLKNKDECEVVIRIGKFKSKEEAATTSDETEAAEESEQ